MKELQNISINPENTILVVVDMENGFCKPGGWRYSEMSARIVPGVISAIQGLVARAHSAGIPVIYIQSVRTLKEPEFTVFGREPHLEVGTWAAEIVEELKPEKRDIIVQKFSHDPFYKPDLDRVLKRLVSGSAAYYAIVTGGALNICVYHAVMGFYLRNYWTVVPVDCVYYLTDAGKERALEQFSESAYPNIFLSRSDLIEVSQTPVVSHPRPVPGK